MILDASKTYSRKNGILYEEGIPIIDFGTFIDVDKLRPEGIDYMNRYMAMYPGNFKLITMKEIKIFYDLETTGTDVRKHGVHQISGSIEVDGVVVETFDFRVAPNPKCVCEAEALKAGKVTEEQIRAYPPMNVVFRKVIALLGKYIDKFDVKDKAWLIGFNNRAFDDIFFRAWFEQNDNTFFGTWFWSDSIDCLPLASQYLIKRRRNMKNFKFGTVAKELGLVVDEDRLHDAAYDAEILREVYRIVTGLEIEM